MLIKGISEKIWVWLLLGLLFICFSVLALISESIYGYGDVYVHYFISHYAFSYPSLFLNHWGKPLFIALSAPFSHFGLIGLQFFNIIISLASARLAYLICQQLKLSFAWLSILLVCFAPIYFVMAYSGLTENLFGLVLVLTVYLFLKEKYLLAAIIISFIPFARTEGTVFIPLFACALLYKRKWMPVIFLFTGFIFYSIIGLFYYHDFFWFFTKNPYTGAQDIYGKGSLWYFAAAYQEIFGAVFSILILIGIVAFCLPLLKKKGFREAFYLVIIILLPPLIYFCGHSFVWWKGIYSSVGLTRVMAGILPLSAVIGVKGLNLAGKYLYQRFRIPSIIFMVLLCCMILYQPFFIFKVPLVEGPEENVLDNVASWITKNKLDSQKIFCLNQYVFLKPA